MNGRAGGEIKGEKKVKRKAGVKDREGVKIQCEVEGLKFIRKNGNKKGFKKTMHSIA